MSYDEVVFVPLISNGPGAVWCHRIVSNEGVTGLYQPYMLPLYGKHDTYGGLVEIERNDYVLFLEERFGASIDDIFLAMVGEKELESFTDVYGSDLYGMWVHRRVWDDLSGDVYRSDYDGGLVGATAWSHCDNDKHALSLMGFVVVDEDTKDARYNIAYRHPAIDGLLVKSDGTWIQVDGVKGWLFHPVDLCEHIKTVYGYEFPVSVKKLFDVRPYEHWYMGRVREMHSVSGRFKGLADDVRDLLLRAISGRDHPLSWIQSNKHKKVFSSVLMEWWMIDMSVDLQTVMSNCYGMNRLFMPSFNGPQDGEHLMERRLHEIALSILEEKLDG